MAKKSILFVDDEPKILTGLERMLRLLRKDMEFHFEESGSKALAFMAAHHVDVIVSDMRMPGMDGAALLAAVQQQFPHVTRVILSGQVNEDAILLTAGVAHQFLVKPSSRETLQAMLERACALQDLLGNEPLQALISSLGSLPSLPSVYSELQRQLKDSKCALKDIAAIIEQDMAMSAKMLQLVNSAFFGFFKNIDSPARAVNLLGLDTVKALVLGVGIFSELSLKDDKSFSVQSLWNHSMGVAAFAKKIAQEETNVRECIDNSFIAGLVHDIGKLIFFSNIRQQYAEVVSLAVEQRLEAYQAEQQILKADHAEAGGYLIGLWGLPGPVVEAVTFHHRLQQYPLPSFCPAVAVHCADVIYHLLKPQKQGVAPQPDLQYLEQAGLGDRFDRWMEICREMGV
jgi:HD-like signal output (HDOD) protein/CheY-like chemotaxis protein